MPTQSLITSAAVCPSRLQKTFAMFADFPQGRLSDSGTAS
jgi:hypothetical protein